MRVIKFPKGPEPKRLTAQPQNLYPPLVEAFESTEAYLYAVGLRLADRKRKADAEYRFYSNYKERAVRRRYRVRNLSTVKQQERRRVERVRERGKQPCPHCGKEVLWLKDHLRNKHKGEGMNTPPVWPNGVPGHPFEASSRGLDQCGYCGKPEAALTHKMWHEKGKEGEEERGLGVE